jgi:hypothetical protein
MAAKCPPRSYSDQCPIAPRGSSRARIVVSAANTATPVGGPACCHCSDPPGSYRAANAFQARIPSYPACALDPPSR